MPSINIWRVPFIHKIATAIDVSEYFVGNCSIKYVCTCGFVTHSSEEMMKHIKSKNWDKIS